MDPGKMIAEYWADLERAGVTDLLLSKENIVPLAIQEQLDGSGSKIASVVSNPRENEMSNEKKSVRISSLEALRTERRARLTELAAEVAKCQRCPQLVENRTKTVFGSGDPLAELVFVGEGPGADEDREGEPFVGRSGRLLTDMITKGMKLRREDVYICNIVRCRPPGNRNPLPIEAECCRPFLEETLKVISPKYICCLGAIAATNLLQTDEPIGKLRGRVHDFHGSSVVCTYHPAYLLRNPPAKALAWEDLKLLMRTMGLID